MRVRTITIALGFVAIFGALWVMWPAPVSPAYWDEPEPPAMTGPLAPDAALREAALYPAGPAGTAEGIATGEDGTVYFGTPDGRIQRLAAGAPDGAPMLEDVAQITDTRILGLDWVRPGVLGIAAVSGLYTLDLDTGHHRLVSTGVPAHSYGYINDLAAAPDGTIYFTDSSTRWGHSANNPGYIYDLLENRPSGAIYAWDPELHQSRLVRDRLYYPNGMELASDGRSLFIAESFRYRILRLWIDGPNAGNIDILADNLPGLPDGIDSDGQGRLFVAMSTRRIPLMRTLHRNPPLARLIAKLPGWMRPSGGPAQGFVLVMDEATGAPLDTLHDPDGRLCLLSNVDITAGGSIWLGSTDCGVIGRLALPDLPAPSGQQPDTGPSAPLLSEHR
ncbi:SMP-30/gluconolactonase/LRE family protein [Maricaulis sp.]|uniref:SMP-30/gluconolactonase/LRE family protein n=1 Tax=Maricaulis sp. TaxID=1486257 RepID=UPI00261867DC|nr:SMP-30/gluconolactonase/LRE family protein [Maricaulis sp.]